MRWAYGLTTVPQRRAALLPQTLKSLAKGGFDNPRLFVDGDNDSRSWESEFNLEITSRFPKIRVFGNWILALAELFIRAPTADRYAIFQDDLITYLNLRQYLEACAYPRDGYWNLYTFPSNQALCPVDGNGNRKIGWYIAHQWGKGALGLVFSREGVLALLSQRGEITERPLDPVRGWRSVDGAVSNAYTKLGIKEYVHNPSLVQHTGLKSTFNRPQPLAMSFRGEDFDALSLINTATYNVQAGAAVYDGFPADARAGLTAGWQKEMETLRKAILDDQERMRVEPNPKRRRQLLAYIDKYTNELRALEVNNPPFVAPPEVTNPK